MDDTTRAKNGTLSAGEEYQETWLRLEDVERESSGKEGKDEVEIEEVIIRELTGRHTKWIEAGREA